jgi:hypothetical protein
LGDGVPPIGDSCHTMKKFCALISKFNSIYSISIPPIDIFVMQPSSELLLDDSSQICFRIVEASMILQFIQSKDSRVTIINELLEVGKLLAPVLEFGPQYFEFVCNILCCIWFWSSRHPGLLHNLEKIIPLNPIVFEPENIGLRYPVPIEILHGTWSEVILARGSTSVLGYSTVQFTEVKKPI